MANAVAYGYFGLKERMADRVADVGVEVVTTATQESVTEYQREQDGLLSSLIQRVTWFSKRIKLPGSATLQPLDQHGNPLPVLPSGSYDVSLPIQGGGTAWGDNRVSRAKMTIEDANGFTWDVMIADMDWVIRHILAALFTNTTWSFVDEEHTTLTIQPLANNDSVVYKRKGAGAPSADNHYKAQANAIDDDNNPFPDIESELMEHPSNSGNVISLVATNLLTSIKAMTNFIPAADLNVKPGIASDVLVGSVDIGPGDKLIGYVDGCYIVEYKRLPDSYIVSYADGADPVIGMREHPEPELQGLFPEFQDVDGNRHLNKFIRYAGFGVVNRVGAVVYRIGNGSYAIPSGFTAPLAV